MKRKTTVKPTAGKFTLLRQICNFIPPHLVPKLARDTGVEKQWRVSVGAITQANPGIKPTRLQAGQKFQILQTTGLPTVSPATTTTGTGSNHGNDCLVKSGDTLGKIACLFGTTPKAIRAENGLTTDRINVGQTLKIPAKSPGQAPASQMPVKLRKLTLCRNSGQIPERWFG